MASSIATRWRDLSGENEWEGLLHPLDADLRRYIIHYGQRASAVGDLFDPNTYGPKTSKENFFSEACLIKGNPCKYEVTDFIYAGSNRFASAWIGYVAVSTDERKQVLGRRDVLVAYRGTATLSEWINDLWIPQVSPSDLFPTATEDALVHGGFHSLYTGTVPDSTHNKTSAREQVLAAVKKLVNKYKHEELSITVTGFSIGGALATLTAMDIVANEYNKPTTSKAPFMVTAFVFGCPRVGNNGFKQLFDSFRKSNLRLLRMKNETDPVPTLLVKPLYTDVGNMLNVNTSVSKYLKKKLFGSTGDAFPDGNGDEECIDISLVNKDDYEAQQMIIFGGWINNIVSCHNMDVYMHGVAIENIAEDTPANNLDYDLPLVNKHLNRVNEDCNIPPDWWVGENRKKMEQMDNGRWRVV